MTIIAVDELSIGTGPGVPPGGCATIPLNIGGLIRDHLRQHGYGSKVSDFVLVLKNEHDGSVIDKVRCEL